MLDQTYAARVIESLNAARQVVDATFPEPTTIRQLRFKATATDADREALVAETHTYEELKKQALSTAFNKIMNETYHKPTIQTETN